MASSIILTTTTTETGSWYQRKPDIMRKLTFQAVVSGTGTVSGTVDIEVSNDGSNSAGVAGTITLPSGTSPVSSGMATDSAWEYWRAKATAISGSSATINVYVNDLF